MNKKYIVLGLWRNKIKEIAIKIVKWELEKRSIAVKKVIFFGRKSKGKYRDESDCVFLDW